MQQKLLRIQEWSYLYSTVIFMDEKHCSGILKTLQRVYQVHEGNLQEKKFSHTIMSPAVCGNSQNDMISCEMQFSPASLIKTREKQEVNAIWISFLPQAVRPTYVQWTTLEFIRESAEAPPHADAWKNSAGSRKVFSALWQQKLTLTWNCCYLETGSWIFYPRNLILKALTLFSFKT